MRKVLLLLALLSSPVWARTYSPNLPLLSAQNPISDSSNWQNGHTNTGSTCYSDVQIDSNHHIVGTEVTPISHPNSCSYNDSIAFVSGTWGTDQCAQATIYIAPTVNSSIAEIELALRASSSGSTLTMYELQFSVSSSNHYWHVAPRLGNDFLGFGNPISSTALGRNLQNGDVIKGCVSGSTFTVSVNGIVIGTGTDTTYSTGSPGVGFYHESDGNGHDSDWGFSSFTATDTTATRPAPPSNLTAIVQ